MIDNPLADYTVCRIQHQEPQLLLDQVFHLGPEQRVARVLDRLTETHGLPQALAVDNGPEFTGKGLEDWAQRSGVKLHFTTPGKPTENGTSRASLGSSEMGA